ncbi:MAG: hypothetical protein EBV15_08015 [Bacteroidetes bacterium]|nr:hypothetical protein [Bacteroidota bacterium]
MRNAALLPFIFFGTSLFAQTDTLITPTDTAGAAEDFSMYDNLVPEETAAAPWASTKIFDLSPQKLISIGYDVQGAYDINMKIMPAFPKFASDTTGTLFTKGSQGLRLGFNIPVISKNRLTWTVAGNYLQNNYRGTDYPTLMVVRNTDYLIGALKQGLTSAGLATTVFVPFDAKRFILMQAQGDVNGNFGLADIGDYFNKTRVSAAVIYGKRPHDRLQWGLGLSRTYRVGEANYVPILFYNYTYPNRKWGIEALFPARAAVRRTFNSRNLLLFGYELEGQTYFLRSPIGTRADSELRRGEARLRFTYEKSLSGFIWMSLQAGYRINTAFNLDEKEFFRGPFGTQPYLMENKAGNAPYIMFSINLVSP